MHFYIFYKFDLCRFWYTVCFCRNCINLLKNLLGINLGNLCISYLWVACFLGEINKIFEFLGLLYFYRVKMNYYLYRNTLSQNLDNLNVTDSQILRVFYFTFYLDTFCCRLWGLRLFLVKWKMQFPRRVATWTRGFLYYLHWSN